mmetsp:Transcript_80981/g.216197  ORF Transcript_80981/g.216197 Transcript_80981/m.216197 type:complete len:568 (-) Transcript_80981:131-1834(-)
MPGRWFVSDSLESSHCVAWLQWVRREISRPLGAMSDIAQQLTLKETDEKKIGLLHMLGRMCSDMSQATGDTVDYVCPQSGRPPVRRDLCDLAVLIDDVKDLIQASGPRGSEIRIGEMKSSKMNLDVQAFRTALRTLLARAVTASESGGVDVQMTVGEETVRLEIVDEGPTFTKHEYEALFVPWFLCKGPDKQCTCSITLCPEDSLGLSFPFAKKVVEAHGGQVWMEAVTAEKGSRTVIEIPLRIPEVPAAEDGKTEHPPVPAHLAGGVDHRLLATLQEQVRELKASNEDLHRQLEKSSQKQRQPQDTEALLLAESIRRECEEALSQMESLHKIPGAAAEAAPNGLPSTEELMPIFDTLAESVTWLSEQFATVAPLMEFADKISGIQTEIEQSMTEVEDLQSRVQGILKQVHAPVPAAPQAPAPAPAAPVAPVFVPSPDRPAALQHLEVDLGFALARVQELEGQVSQLQDSLERAQDRELAAADAKRESQRILVKVKSERDAAVAANAVLKSGLDDMQEECRQAEDLKKQSTLESRRARDELNKIRAEFDGCKKELQHAKIKMAQAGG